MCLSLLAFSYSEHLARPLPSAHHSSPAVGLWSVRTSFSSCSMPGAWGPPGSLGAGSGSLPHVPTAHLLPMPPSWLSPGSRPHWGCAQLSACSGCGAGSWRDARWPQLVWAIVLLSPKLHHPPWPSQRLLPALPTTAPSMGPPPGLGLFQSLMMAAGEPLGSQPGSHETALAVPSGTRCGRTGLLCKVIGSLVSAAVAPGSTNQIAVGLGICVPAGP